jgi:hypothetical protein
MPGCVASCATDPRNDWTAHSVAVCEKKYTRKEEGFRLETLLSFIGLCGHQVRTTGPDVYLSVGRQVPAIRERSQSIGR